MLQGSGRADSHRDEGGQRRGGNRRRRGGNEGRDQGRGQAILGRKSACVCVVCVREKRTWGGRNRDRRVPNIGKQGTRQRRTERERVKSGRAGSVGGRWGRGVIWGRGRRMGKNNRLYRSITCSTRSRHSLIEAGARWGPRTGG